MAFSWSLSSFIFLTCTAHLKHSAKICSYWKFEHKNLSISLVSVNDQMNLVLPGSQCNANSSTNMLSSLNSVWISQYEFSMNSAWISQFSWFQSVTRQTWCCQGVDVTATLVRSAPTWAAWDLTPAPSHLWGAKYVISTIVRSITGTTSFCGWLTFIRKGTSAAEHVMVIDVILLHLRRSSVQFKMISVRLGKPICAQRSLYALHPICQKFPQSCRKEEPKQRCKLAWKSVVVFFF